MPDLHLHQLSQEPLPADLISVITDVLKQQETWNLLKEPQGKMQPTILMPGDNPKNREDLAV
jgi:hypothetical protein